MLRPPMSAPFAVCFIGSSYPIPGDQFTAAGPSQLVLDVVAKVNPQFWELKEVALFLTAPSVLDVGTGLGLYIKVGAGEWQYRGCVHGQHPSEAMPLVWPEIPPGVTGGPPGGVLIGAQSLPDAVDLAQAGLVQHMSTRASRSEACSAGRKCASGH